MNSLERQYNGRAMRAIKRILDASRNEPEPVEPDLCCAYDYKPGQAFWTLIFMGMVFVLCLIASCQTAHAYTLDQWADAIGHAENSKTHPYGIMVKYRHTSPRQACKNTVLHQYRNWLNIGHPGAFVGYLASHYAPLNASNDPTALNVNWQRNVLCFLRKGNL